MVDEPGSCDANNVCDGQIQAYIDQGWEAHMVPNILNLIKFVDKNPFLNGPVAFASAGHLVSAYDPLNKTSHEIDTQITAPIHSFAIELIALYLIWMLFAYVMSIMLRRVVYRFTGRRMAADNFLWDMIAANCDQDNFYPKFESLKILSMSIVVAFFFIVQFFCGEMSTSLTVVEKMKYIDTLEDLLQSNRCVIIS